MSGNPLDSQWYITPCDARKRKPMTITLSDAARERLDRMAVARTASRSQILDDLVMGATIRAKRPTR